MSFSSNSTTAPAQADARLTLLKAWLSTLNLVAPDSARPASSDASFRRYYRLDVLPGTANVPGATLIAMDAPPERENVPAFVKVAGLLKSAGVSVPEIVAQDLDNGFLLVKEDERMVSPLAVLFYEEYEDLSSAQDWLTKQSEQIQCIVSTANLQVSNQVVDFGQSQQPALWDYADGIDTMQFLTNL